MTDWPDLNKRGVPINSDKDGWHWVQHKQASFCVPYEWRTPGFWVNRNNLPMIESEQAAFVEDCRYIGPCLTPNQVADLVHDQIVGMYHPEFGTEWCEPDGSLFVLFNKYCEYSKERGRKQGLQEAEQAIRQLIDKR